MALPERDTDPGLSLTARAVIGILAVIGFLSLVRWLVGGLMSLLGTLVLLAVVYLVVKAVLRR